MPNPFARIDDRLVHGQVVESWIPFIQSERVCVVSDEAAEDAMQKELMALAIPEGIELEVLTIKEAIAVLPERMESMKTMVLVPSPREILALLEGGIRFECVNVGGLHYSAGRVQLGKVIFISEDDRKALRQILSYGVALEGRGVPSDPLMDMGPLLA